MANETPTPAAESTPAPQGGKSKMDKYVKLGFLAAVIIIVGVISYRQYLGPQPPGEWRGDLPAALEQAAKENRDVVVLFYQRPPSEEYKHLIELTLSKPRNLDALAKSHDILVVSAPSSEDPLVKKYNITVWPTTLLLAPDGHEITRREGFIAEMDLIDFLKGAAKK